MDELQIAVFVLGKEKYAIPISQIEEIIKYQKITNLPSQPEYVEGLMNVRGRVIVVINLAKKLKFNIENIEDKRIIIANVDGHIVGMSVDYVNEIIKVKQEDIQNSEESGVKVDYVKGIIKHNNDIIILLDLQKLILD